MKIYSKYQLQKGLTLVELMVAITIGMFLLNGVLQIFGSSKQTYLVNEQLARLQEDGRRAMDIITGDFRLIGYQGCADPDTIDPVIMANDPPTTNLIQTGVRAAEVNASQTWSPVLPASIPTVTNDAGATINLGTSALANSDVIIAQYANPTGITLMGNLTATNANIQIDSNSAGFAADDILIISDCSSVDIFRATNVSSSSGTVTIAHSNSSNSGNFLQKVYAADAQIMRFESNLYFVGASGLDEGTTYTNKKGDTINALYKVDANGNLTEIVQGVENLQILYGERLATGNIRYLEADDANLDMSQVETLKIGLLLSTLESVASADDTTTYDVNNTSIGPTGTTGVDAEYDATDRRIRRVFSTAIYLRNRG